MATAVIIASPEEIAEKEAQEEMFAAMLNTMFDCNPAALADALRERLQTEQAHNRAQDFEDVCRLANERRASYARLRLRRYARDMKQLLHHAAAG